MEAFEAARRGRPLRYPPLSPSASASRTCGRPSGSARLFDEDNAACDWRIACPSGKATLDFTEFATESDYDFVTVYDGADASAPKLGELSGALVDILDTHFDAGSDVLLVEFTSDESITDGGFQARYTCG